MKEYHEEECNCPCWKYKTSNDRNRCSHCFHYHTTTPVNPEKNRALAEMTYALKTEKATVMTQKSAKQPIGRVVYKK